MTSSLLTTGLLRDDEGNKNLALCLSFPMYERGIKDAIHTSWSRANRINVCTALVIILEARKSFYFSTSAFCPSFKQKNQMNRTWEWGKSPELLQSGAGALCDDSDSRCNSTVCAGFGSAAGLELPSFPAQLRRASASWDAKVRDCFKAAATCRDQGIKMLSGIRLAAPRILQNIKYIFAYLQMTKPAQ